MSCLALGCEQGDGDQIKQAIADTISEFGRIDILVNNAGTIKRSPAHEFSDDDWNEVVKMNLEYSNIFDAITEDKAEASELQTRSDLMIVIRDIINAKNWSQADAAIQLGLTQPRVSDLVNGRIDKFSIDKLMTCLYRIGFRFKPSFADDQLTMAVEAVKAH